MKRLRSPRSWWILGLILLLLGAPALWAAPEVEWLVDSEEFTPSTTLEIRFAREMVSREQLGVAVEESPLVFQPALKGKFTWLSRRSGVFVPAEAPRMGATFSVALRAGLKDAAGKPLDATFRATLKTPAFAAARIDNGVSEPDAIPPQPELRLAFNRDLKLDGAEKLFRFVDAGGKSIAAVVRYALPKDHFGIEPEEEDWDRRWKLAQDAEPAPKERDEDDDEKQEPLRNRLIMTPAVPLTPGGAWRAEMKAGLEAISGGYRIKEARTIALGRVRPFTVTSTVASSYLNSGRSLTLTFSEDLAPDVNEETGRKFFRVTPEVKNLRFEPGGKSLVIRGDFDRETEYRVEIDALLLAESGLALTGERRRTVRFARVKPRVFLPEITGHQILGGRRKFPMLSVNMQSLRVVARRVEPDEAARAVAAFEKYDKEYDEKMPGETYQALPPGLITGKIIADRTLALPAPQVDARQETTLDWDEIVGRETAGMIFLTVEGQPLAPIAGKHPAAQALIQLTDLGVLWKTLADRLEVTVFSMATGKPVESARVALLGEKFGRISSAQSDAQGAAKLASGGDAAWLMVRRGADAHAVRIGQGRELPMAAFNVPIVYNSLPEEKPWRPVRALIFTDRPLYRPGETVHVKGIVRGAGESGLALAAGLKGTLTLYQPHDRGEKTIEVRTDERGAFDAQVALDFSTTGAYALRLKLEGSKGAEWQSGFGASFQVADFQPNAFEVSVAAPARFAPAAEVAAEVSAKYFFGAPLGKSTVRWTLQYAPEWFAPAGFPEFSFGVSNGAEMKTLTLHGEGALSDAGAFAIRPKLPEAKERVSRGLFTVEVTDVNQQTVSESRGFVRDSADFYVGLKSPEEYVIGHAQEIVARAVALRPDGQPLPEPVAVKVELVRLRYDTVRVQAAGGAVTFHTEKSEEIVASAEGRTLVPERSGEEWRLPLGDTARFKPGKAGQYLLRVVAKDAHGRATVAAINFSVSGTDATTWEYRNPAQLDLVPEKAEYRAGETARLLVKTPISGEALVTVERGARLLRTQRVRLEGNAPIVEIPIEAGDTPNVFVSLVLLRGADQSRRKFKVPEYRYGLCQLRVADPASALKVEVVPKAPTVQPGDEVLAEVRIHDGNGQAVADAEVTFFAVDDGVLALTGYERPQPRAIFETPFPLAVRTGLTLFELLPEDPADLEFANKGYLIGGGGIEGPGMKLRRDFPGTACWFPALRTDKAGLVTVRFKAPDALTRYRLVAVAHAGANRFGSGESAFNIRKKLMILSALGQAANVGDEIVARAVVSNESGANGTAEVALVLDSTAEPAQKPLAAKLALKNGEARTVDFPVRLRAMGDADWQWTARLEANGEVFDDAIAASLKVGSPVPVLHETYLTELAGATNDLLAGVNPQVLEGDGTVRVTLSNTRLSSLRETATDLLEYPYGCAEQTVSALVPWIVMKDLGPVLPDLVKNKEDVRKAIRAGVDKIFALQTPGGGLAYWPGGREAELFPSAYAVLVLALLEKQGEELPPGWAKLLEYVSGKLRGEDTKRAAFALDDSALAVFALATAGKAEPAYHEQLYALRGQLSLEARALLALAVIEAKGPANMVAKLLDPRAAAPEAFTWFGSATRERGVRLMAWSRLQPNDPEVGRLVKELLASRVNGHWRTTQENAWAMLALSRYYRTIEREVKPVEGALAKAGVAVPFALTKTQLTKTVNFAFDGARPLGALSVENPRRSNLYGEANFVVRPPVAAQPRQDRGYAVSRSYRKIAADGSLGEAADLRVGDRVLVTLRLETPRPGHFVAIDDPLPAILEAINPEFRGPGEGIEGDRADYREIRADRVLYFCDHLPAGAFTFRYLARVRTAGKVTAPAAKAEEMYRPERFGLSATAQLESRAAER
ncbi:MAG: alpha-2-macroglobulin [Chthoniobacter sp.]|jgi:uncharacterized protein YfaS (alpha-2-macroglobulin family)|nr:alpha-2-macroglobulin [Chthoniobacter sp.]